MGEIFGKGLTDREELAVASINFRVTAPAVTPEKDPVKTGDNRSIAVWAFAGTLALGGLYIAIKKSKKEEA